MLSAAEALARLRDGNRRVVQGMHDHNTTGRRLTLSQTQEPFAIILGCSDARVPAELVFGQGFGDLFVIRVAGNIVAPSQVGSVEFGVERFGTRLVVVMGHTACSAILATLEEIESPGGTSSRNLRSIVDRVRPSIEPLISTELALDRAALLREAMRANVRVAASHLRHGSQLLEHLILNDGLLVVGAEYNLETGAVEFFDGAESGA